MTTPYKPLDLQILVLTQDQVTLGALKNHFSKLKLPWVTYVDTFKDAMSALDLKKVNLVFCDLEISNLSGLVFARMIKLQKQFDHVRFFVMSPPARQKNVQKNVLDGYLAKPINPKNVDEILKVFPLKTVS